jgi:IPT/TIG domain/FG-GAP repeat
MGRRDARNQRRKLPPRALGESAARGSARAYAIPRRGALLAAAALALGALLWQLFGAGHAQAQRAVARYAAAADPLETAILSGEGATTEAAAGFSVALSGDGGTALVGAPHEDGNTGAVWVFVRSGSSWTQQAKLSVAEEDGSEGPCGEEVPTESEECGFGRSVALSGDGNVALIGSPRNKEHAGAAWVFTRSGSTWTRAARLIGGEAVGSPHFGRSVALSADATTAVVGGAADRSGHGAVWVFSGSGSAWTQSAKVTAPEEAGGSFFGVSVALSLSGEEMLVGAPGYEHFKGAAWPLSRSGETWSAGAPLLAGGEVGEGHFGSSVALSGDGATALVGARADADHLGAAWAFANEGGTWSQLGPKLTGGSEGAVFGSSVALSGNGEAALVGGPANNDGLGAAWFFKRSGSAYVHNGGPIPGTETPSLERLGASVALSQTGSEALLGAPRSNERRGAALVLMGIPVPPPTVRHITPTSGPTAGGTGVTIEGTGFLPGAKVAIGSEATSVNVISESKITAVTSATAAGPAEVVVSDGYGTSTAGPAFTYEAPPTETTPTSSTASPLPPNPPPSQGGVLGSTASAVPPPVLGVSGNIAPVGGKVFLRLPGSKKFVLLTELLNIPFGTIVDARKGKAEITTMGAHGLQTIDFYEGEFKLTQSSNAMVTAALYGGDFSVCPTKRERAHRARVSARASRKRSSHRHIVRKLWASGHGTYSTKGNYATGAVLGTIWETIDRCNGTGVRVITDSVLVTNRVTHKHVRVKAGHTYIAKAP